MPLSSSHCSLPLKALLNLSIFYSDTDRNISQKRNNVSINLCLRRGYILLYMNLCSRLCVWIYDLSVGILSHTFNRSLTENIRCHVYLSSIYDAVSWRFEASSNKKYLKQSQALEEQSRMCTDCKSSGGDLSKPAPFELCFHDLRAMHYGIQWNQCAKVSRDLKRLQEFVN